MDQRVDNLIRERCYVDGQWVGEPKLSVTNPANGAEIAKVPLMDAAGVRQAIEAAETAFKTWSKTTAKERSNLLRKWYNLIIENADKIAAIMTAEQGKPLAEAKGEVVYAANFIEFFAEEAKRVYGETIPTFKADARIVVIKQPIGVVAAITPWNFPAAMITRKAGPGARRRLHGRLQARLRDAADGARTRRARPSGRHPQGRVQRRHRQGSRASAAS